MGFGLAFGLRSRLALGLGVGVACLFGLCVWVSDWPSYRLDFALLSVLGYPLGSELGKGLVGLAAGLAGLGFGLILGLRKRLALGLGFGMAYGVMAGLSFAPTGLALGLVGFALGLAFGVALELRTRLAFGLAFGLALGLFGGLGFEVRSVGGLDAWLYYHWLRHRLARQGRLPRRLQPFLEWCAAPERGWLRLSDACEFRHRELLDHLALETEAEGPE
jgi:hypothetical protein